MLKVFPTHYKLSSLLQLILRLSLALTPFKRKNPQTKNLLRGSLVCGWADPLLSYFLLYIEIADRSRIYSFDEQVELY
jgi:hypothetical protein